MPRGRFTKGSEEARAWGQKMKEARGRGLRKHKKRSKGLSDSDSESDEEYKWKPESHDIVHVDIEGRGYGSPPSRLIEGSGYGTPPSRLPDTFDMPLAQNMIKMYLHHKSLKGGKVNVSKDLKKAGKAIEKSEHKTEHAIAKSEHKTEQGIKNAESSAVHDAKWLGNPDNKKKMDAEAIKDLKSAAHYAIPAATSALGAMAAEALAPELGPVSGIAGSAGGAWVGNQINKKLGVGLRKIKGRGIF